MSALNGTTVLVLGLGASGLAMARWCASQGAAVRAWDTRAEPPQAEAVRDAVPEAVVLGGALDAAALDGVQRVLKSPGLAPHDERIAPLLAAARARAIAVQGELDLYVEALAALKVERGYGPQVVAITGTNGKTTTTALAGLLIERCGQRVAVAGNIGPSMLDTLRAAIEGDALPDVWVLELSSFQLADARRFEPTAAAVLNVSQDHLDWHGNLDAYAAAKTRVYGEHAVMVVNRDDPAVEAMVPTPAPKAKTPSRKVVRFGLAAPRAPGDFGLVTENGIAWLARALESDEPSRRRKPGDEAEPLHLQRLMPADALRIRGRHNAANALAALALAMSIGCPLAPMLHALRDYRGEPHRVQFVARIGQVDAYDDSKGTNVGATVAALEGLGADLGPGKLVVILGGDGKGQDFAPLAAPIARHARAVALIGRDAGAIAEVLGAAASPDGPVLARHPTLEAATAWCFDQARPGDAVLLSPACASLDMFSGYAQRAQVFVDAVHARAAAQGEIA